MTPEQAHVVATSWRAVLPVGGTFAELFYGKLFALDPTIRKLFREDPVEQGRNLTAMLSVAAANIARPEKIELALRQLGTRHAAYGVKPEHFPAAEAALLFALEHALIDIFTPEVKAAWQAAFDHIASRMLATAPSRPRAGP